MEAFLEARIIAAHDVNQGLSPKKDAFLAASRLAGEPGSTRPTHESEREHLHLP